VRNRRERDDPVQELWCRLILGVIILGAAAIMAAREGVLGTGMAVLICYGLMYWVVTAFAKTLWHTGEHPYLLGFTDNKVVLLFLVVCVTLILRDMGVPPQQVVTATVWLWTAVLIGVLLAGWLYVWATHR